MSKSLSHHRFSTAAAAASPNSVVVVFVVVIASFLTSKPCYACTSSSVKSFVTFTDHWKDHSEATEGCSAFIYGLTCNLNTDNDAGTNASTVAPPTTTTVSDEDTSQRVPTASCQWQDKKAIENENYWFQYWAGHCGHQLCREKKDVQLTMILAEKLTTTTYQFPVEKSKAYQVVVIGFYDSVDNSDPVACTSRADVSFITPSDCWRVKSSSFLLSLTSILTFAFHSLIIDQ